MCGIVSAELASDRLIANRWLVLSSVLPVAGSSLEGGVFCSMGGLYQKLDKIPKFDQWKCDRTSPLFFQLQVEVRGGPVLFPCPPRPHPRGDLLQVPELLRPGLIGVAVQQDGRQDFPPGVRGDEGATNAVSEHMEQHSVFLPAMRAGGVTALDILLGPREGFFFRPPVFHGLLPRYLFSPTILPK